MSRMATFLYLFISSATFAAPDLGDLDQKFCQFLKTNLGPGQYQTNPLLHVEEQGMDYFIQRRGQENIFFSSEGDFPIKAGLERYRDFVIHGDRFYTVGKSNLSEFSLQGELMERHLETKPRGMYLHAADDVLFLASGDDGLQAFDLRNKKLLFTHPLNTVNDDGQRSAAVAITGDGNSTLYIAMTGSTQYGFNGVLTFDLRKNQISAKSEYNKRRAGVIDVYPQIYNRTDEVILNNGGWIHRIKKSDLRTKKTILPKWHAIPHVVGDYRQFIRIAGDLIFDQGEVRGCATYNIRDLRQTKTGAFSTNL
jgi:hypothetical protein